MFFLAAGCGQSKSSDEASEAPPVAAPSAAEASVKAGLGAERAVKDFTNVALLGAFDLEISQGPDFSVHLEASAEDLSKVTTIVKAGELTISCHDPNAKVSECGKVTARVVLPQLDGIVLSGAGDIKGMTPFTSKSFAIDLKGAGDIELRLELAGKLVTAITGSGDVKLSGKGDSMDVKVAGSGVMRAGSFATREALVAITGSGDVELDASESLTVEIQGSGDVRYSGTATLTESIKGSGAVHKR